MLPPDDDIIAALPAPPETIPFRALATALGVDRSERPLLRTRLHGLVAEGQMSRVRGNRYGLPKAESHRGTLTMSRRGFGFVSLEGEGDDVYVDGRCLNGAVHRDRVALELRQSHKGRTEGVVTAVLDRGTRTFVGTYREAARSRVVHPQDNRLPEHVIIEKRAGAKDGDLIAAEFTRYPDHPHGAAARVLRVFDGDEASAQATDRVVYDLGLRIDFPGGVQSEVEGLSDRIDPAELARRTDLRRRALVTVDPESAKDFDDAVHAEPLEGGGWRLTVAIADVSYFVRPQTAVDEEAHARGLSVYLPDRVIPMLPHRLSSDLCSLRPEVERYAMAVEVTISPTGELVEPRFMEAVIRSHARFTYDRAARLLGLLDAPPATDESASHEAQRPVLMALRDATRVRRKFRKRRGYLSIDLPEPRVVFAPDGTVEDIRPGSRHEAHLMIEEAMLAANEAVGAAFVAKDWPALFRVHDAPPADNLTRLRSQAALLGATQKGLSNTSADGLSRWLARHADHALYPLLAVVLLRSMAKATYREEPSLHFGLGSQTYLHFTSPIRRYPDLVVHRLLKRMLGGGSRPNPERLAKAAAHAARREKLAVDAERTVLDLHKCLFLSERIGEEFDGLIVAATSMGVFVQLEAHSVEGLLNVEQMEDDYYAIDDAGVALVGRRKGGRFQLGDRLRVRVMTVSVHRRRVNFELVERLPAK